MTTIALHDELLLLMRASRHRKQVCRAGLHLRAPKGRCRDCRRASELRYRDSDKGRAKRAAYDQSEAGLARHRIANAKYERTLNGVLTRTARRLREESAAHKAAWAAMEGTE